MFSEASVARTPERSRPSATRWCQEDVRMPGRTPDQDSKGGLKRCQQKRWIESTLTAKVDRSDVNGKGGPKLCEQQSSKTGSLVGDYGTTPLIWACRKGHLAIVDILFGEGANKDASGMNSWTPILVATKNGHFDIVRSVLKQEPNVNATDKDGLTALAIAAREGYFEVVNELLAKGAYVNIQDRNGDSILIHAVKGGHVDIVKALLKKFADVDVEGQDSKTALYCAVEKGYTDIVRLLLQNNPDLERCTKRGDTALHIAIRARNKRITELLLRNPRHSRLLYRLNKDGESPYSMDTYHQKGILPQIYGHGNLNATDAENLLGYEIYSSALADILSEPSLITPITMGLYAKWGSGKSFLLDKLRVEMKSFSQQNCLDELRWTWLTAFMLLLLCVLIGEALGLAISWLVGLCTGLILLIVMYSFIGIMVRLTQRHDFSWSNRLSFALGRRQKLLTLFLKMLFCVPKQKLTSEKQAGSPFFVRFLFSECTRLTSVGGEKSLAAMIGTLCDAVEKEYGVITTRLFRVFKPPPSKSNRSRGFFKSLCCIPLFLIMLLLLACILVGVGLLIKGNLRKTCNF
ncbi:kinase D-interacting substrate of 220 kDa [Elysia marginata]|uniref:Kinase D-interacting substrate of 220 kDa n=1 Tax=Elysia marginata TaxID=1093978 RepID=A0AAV4JZ82_9GAST|nr:kinase D-interacting substrate of 220 kDa [Elysia marginata]